MILFFFYQYFKPLDVAIQIRGGFPIVVPTKRVTGNGIPWLDVIVLPGLQVISYESRKVVLEFAIEIQVGDDTYLHINEPDVPEYPGWRNARPQSSTFLTQPLEIDGQGVHKGDLAFTTGMNFRWNLRQATKYWQAGRFNLSILVSDVLSTKYRTIDLGWLVTAGFEELPTPSASDTEAPLYRDRKNKFVERMKVHAGEKRTAYISVMRLNDVRLAKDLDAEFKLAGWQTNLSALPQAEGRSGNPHADFDGTRVMGHGNKALVDAVADALVERGCEGVFRQPNPDPKTIAKSKYEWVINRVYVTIGNQAVRETRR